MPWRSCTATSRGWPGARGVVLTVRLSPGLSPQGSIADQRAWKARKRAISGLWTSCRQPEGGSFCAAAYRRRRAWRPGQPLPYVERPCSLFMARRTARPAARALSSLRAICSASSTTTRAALAAASLTWGLEASFCAVEERHGGTLAKQAACHQTGGYSAGVLSGSAPACTPGRCSIDWVHLGIISTRPLTTFPAP